MATYKRRLESREPDQVNHPAHYTFGNIEVLDVIDDWGMNFERSCVLKYLARAGKKSPETEIEDLEKAAFYLRREIERLKNEAGTGCNK